MLLRKIGLLVLLLVLSACGPDPALSPEAQEEVKKIFELSSVELVFRDVVYHKAQEKFLDLNLPWGTKEVLFSIDVRVRAGFDLTEGYEIKPRSDKQNVEVTFPSPQILSVDADDETIQEYFTDGKALGYVRLQDLLQARTEAIRTQALGQGILEKARVQAHLFVDNFFHSLGYQTISLKFRASSGKSDE